MKKWEDFELAVARFFDLKLSNNPKVYNKGKNYLIDIRNQVYKDEKIKDSEMTLLHFSEIILSNKAEMKLISF